MVWTALTMNSENQTPLVYQIILEMITCLILKFKQLKILI
jgi:hypothetical protein